MTTIQIEDKVDRNFKQASRIMRVKKKELIDRALLLYVESIRDLLNLEKEFDAWDALSDEAMLRMTKSPVLHP